MYHQPKLEDALPKEVHVGKLSEIYVRATEDAPFWQRKYIYFIFQILRSKLIVMFI